jgi:hypothetical protein
MLGKLIKLQPPVLPMSSREQFIRAAQEALAKGGKNGGPRAAGAVDDFKRAVRLWHAKQGTTAVDSDLSSPWATAVFSGIIRSAPAPLPKNINVMPDAEHGNLALPLEVLLRCIAYVDAKVKANPQYNYLGLKRDILIAVFLFFLTRRFNEVWQMTRLCLFDLGVGNGFNWVIIQMKNKQKERIVVPVPEYSWGGINIGARLREFLLISPFDGRLFHDTTMMPGSNLHSWCPRWGVKQVKDEYGVLHDVTFEQGMTSSDWNSSFRRLLVQAIPGMPSCTRPIRCA